MEYIIAFIIYWITISIIAYLIKIPDVVKINGEWSYNKNFEKGDIVSMPFECIVDISSHKVNYE